MRLFVGVRVDEPLISAAETVAGRLRRRLGRNLHVRWIALENMHVTVRFIGNVDENRVSDVLNALRPALPVAPFELELGECGGFPPSGSLRVIWIGLTKGLPSLRLMHEECDRRLAPLGFEPEQREFSAHLTLARITDAPRSASQGVRDALAAVRSERVRCMVTSATVFQSRLAPRGAMYQPLFDIPCTG